MMSRFRSFMAEYGVNVSGFLFNAGGAFQLIAGAVLDSPRDIASAVINFLSATIMVFWGHKNSAVIVSAALAILIDILTAYAGLAAAEATSLVGISLHIPMQIIAMCNVYLSRRFGASPLFLMRETLGQPRRFIGYFSFVFCRLPLIFGNGLHQRWIPAIVFAIWALADLSFGMSKAKTSSAT